MNVIRILKRACLVPALVLFVGQAIVATGQTVLIDFGSNTSFRGLSVPNPDSKGNYWNSLQPGLLVSNLIDIQNHATTIQIGWDTPVATDSYNGPAGPTAPLPPAFPTYASYLPLTDIDQEALGNLGGALEAAFDFAASPGFGDNKTRFQIQQLDPAKKYDLTFFASHKYEGDVTTVFTVYSNNTYTTPVGTVSLDVRDPLDPSLHNRSNVATISNLSPQESNILYVEFVGSTGNLGYLNDMQIVGTSTALTGDYNLNGTVDAADYVMWRENPDGFGGNPGGFNTWRLNFGNTSAGLGSGINAAATIPEPASLIVCVLGMMGWFGACARRR